MTLPTRLRPALPLTAMASLLLAGCAGAGPVRDPPASPAPISTSAEQSSGWTPDHHDPHLHAGPPARTPLPSPIVVPLDAAVLAQLPREPVTAAAHGRTLRCEGIALATLLRTVDAMPDEPLKGPQLTRYVQAEGRDGYRAVFALAELDPTLGNRQVYVVDRCDGQPLSADDGPLRLVAPSESRAARWVRQLKSVVVIVAP